jgi:hypothetical protein
MNTQQSSANSRNMLYSTRMIADASPMSTPTHNINTHNVNTHRAVKPDPKECV